MKGMIIILFRYEFIMSDVLEPKNPSHVTSTNLCWALVTDYSKSPLFITVGEAHVRVVLKSCWAYNHGGHLKKLLINSFIIVLTLDSSLIVDLSLMKISLIYYCLYSRIFTRQTRLRVSL